MTTQIYDRVGVVFLGYIRGDLETGLYAASERLIVTVSMVFVMFRNVFLPILTQISGGSSKRMFRFCEGTALIMVLVLAPGVMLLFAVSSPLITFLYGPAFAESAPIMRILCWSLVFIALTHVFSSLLIVTECQKILSRINALVCLIYLMLTPLMIWFFGSEGLAWMRLACSALLLTMVLGYVNLRIHHLSVSRWFAPVAASVINTAIFLLFPSCTLWIRVPLLLFGYFSILLLMGGLCRQDYIFLREMFGRNK